MALQTKKGELPKDAVRLSREEAIDYQWKQILDWPEKSDIYAFRLGVPALGVVTAATGAHINNLYRRKLKLRMHGFVSSSLPVIFTPVIFSTMVHSNLVTHNLFLDQAKCPVCIMHRAVCIQIGCAVLYPLVLSPIVNFATAFRHASFQLPYYSDVKGNSKLWLELTKPLGKRLLLLSSIHAVLAGLLTYSEAACLHTIRTKLQRAASGDTAKISELDDEGS